MLDKKESGYVRLTLSEVIELTLVVCNCALGCSLNHRNLSLLLRESGVELTDIENIARELWANWSLDTLCKNLLVIELSKPWVGQNFF